MSRAVNKSSVTESNDVMGDVLSAEFSKVLQMVDDFVWIENTPAKVCPFEDHSSSEANTFVNVAQHETNPETSETAKECQPEHTENVIALSLEWEKEVLVDQEYWEQKGAVAQRENNTRLKYPASQRLTVTELNKIALHNAVTRDPAYFKFNISTTAILKALIDKKIVGSYQNVLGKGNCSVVIHAHYPPKTYDTHGMVVKVYKLSSDVKKNNAILKRAKREYEHLVTLKYNCRVPSVNHRMKNVIVLGFLGSNQGPMPSLSSLPPEYAEHVYKMIVAEINNWYTKFNIVHGKLCAKSILYDTTVYPSYYYYDNNPCRPYVIGWGHSVKSDHPRALMKLMRDCHFVTNFFESRNVPVKSTIELFKNVTGLEQINNEVLDAMYKKDLWQAGQLTNPNRL